MGAIYLIRDTSVTPLPTESGMRLCTIIVQYGVTGAAAGRPFFQMKTLPLQNKGILPVMEAGSFRKKMGPAGRASKIATRSRTTRTQLDKRRHDSTIASSDDGLYC